MVVCKQEGRYRKKESRRFQKAGSEMVVWCAERVAEEREAVGMVEVSMVSVMS